MASEKFSVSMPDDLVARIDRVRGPVSRSAWLASLAEAKLDGHLVENIGKVARARPTANRRHLPTCKCSMCKPGARSGG